MQQQKIKPKIQGSEYIEVDFSLVHRELWLWGLSWAVSFPVELQVRSASILWLHHPDVALRCPLQWKRKLE